MTNEEIDKCVKGLRLKILTGLKAAQSEEEGWFVNPFYGQNEQIVRANLEEAKKIWPEVFAHCVSSYIIGKAVELGIIPDSLKSFMSIKG